MIRLIDVYDSRGEPRLGAISFLYDLMLEREPEINISHKEMPTMAEHVRFVKRHPFRLWYLIDLHYGFVGGSELSNVWVGYVSATHLNEIGVIIKKAYRFQGIGPEAVKDLMQRHRPAQAIMSQRNGHWLANINPENTASRLMFDKLGFKLISQTYALQEETHGNQATHELRPAGSAGGGSQTGNSPHPVESPPPAT